MGRTRGDFFLARARAIWSLFSYNLSGKKREWRRKLNFILSSLPFSPLDFGLSLAGRDRYFLVWTYPKFASSESQSLPSKPTYNLTPPNSLSETLEKAT